MSGHHPLAALAALAALCGPARAGDFDLLFLHHSVGANWLKNGLRAGLEDPLRNRHDFRVHGATYGDRIGNDTDVCHWHPKFRDLMTEVFLFDRSQNQFYSSPTQINRIVMFKPCYPNSAIGAVGTPPGDPVSQVHTIWNHKAAYEACAAVFRNHPSTLFVAVTAPPLNPAATTAADAARAREFHTWLATTWVQACYQATGLRNVAAFDLFDVLANPASHPTEPNQLRAAFRTGADSHPTGAGDAAATAAFLPFLNQAVDDWLAAGGGCRGTANLIPAFTEAGLPRVGNLAFALKLSAARPGSHALVLASHLPARVPLTGGCTLTLAGPPLGLLAPIDAQGLALTPMPIPGNPSLAGLKAFFQAFVFDASGPIGPGILVASNGLAVGIAP